MAAENLIPSPSLKNMFIYSPYKVFYLNNTQDVRQMENICEKSEMPRNNLHRLTPQRAYNLLELHTALFDNGVELLAASSGVEDFP
jgi:hypothetical protein